MRSVELDQVTPSHHIKGGNCERELQCEGHHSFIQSGLMPTLQLLSAGHTWTTDYSALLYVLQQLH